MGKNSKSVYVVLFVVLFIPVFLVYHIIFSPFFPADENNVLQAPEWYAPIGMLIASIVSGVVTWKQSKKHDKEFAKKQKEQKEQEELESKANELRRDIEESQRRTESSRVFAEKINASYTVKDFSTAYRGLMDDFAEMARIANRSSVEFGYDPSEKANEVSDNMETLVNDFIDRAVGIIPEKALDWPERVFALIAEMRDDLVFTSFWKPSHEEKVSKLVEECKSRRTSIRELELVDQMEGHQFEHWCASLLQKNGFSNVSVTPGSGDHGVDVLAEKDGIHYAIQCKCYSHDLGNTPVQEVYAGKEMYRCQVGVVMTNRGFTSGAKQLAEQTRVLLWDRAKLRKLIDGV